MPTDERNQEHAMLAPSSMHRIIPCPHSKQANLMEQESNDAADAGTEQHDWAAGILQGRRINPDDATDLWDVTKRYIHFVHSLTADVTVELSVEVTLRSEQLPEHFFGTIDALIVDGDTLTVVDLKTGRVPVRAKDNLQLKSYLCLARDHHPDATKFFGCIVQGDPDMVEFTAEELDDHYTQVHETFDSDEKSAGEHCKYCPLKLTCDANREWMYEQALEIFEPDDEPDIEYCKDLIARKAVIDEAAAEAAEYLKKVMLRGEDVPGWKLGQKYGNRAWLKDVLNDEFIGGVPLYEKTVKSPATVEKDLKNTGFKPKEAKALVDPLVTREKKPPVAVPEETRCEAYVLPAEQLFDDLEEKE